MQFLNPSPLPFYQTSQAVSIRQSSAANRALVIHSGNIFALPSEKTGLNAKFSHENLKVDIFKAEKTGKLRIFTEVDFFEAEIGALPARCSLAGCFSEKTGKSAKNGKPGNVGKSTLTGVEVGEALTTASGGDLVRAEVNL